MSASLNKPNRVRPMPVPDLPDDVAAMVAPHLEDVLDMNALVSAVGVELASKRDEAKAARTSSGIEAVWRECEERYLGLDDANRGEFTDAKWAKPMSIEGPVTTGRPKGTSDHRSTVFLRLTSRYVDAGTAKLAEILLPADDKAFSFSEMPVPELTQASKDDRQVVHSQLGVPLTKPADPVPGGGQPATPAPAAGAPPGGQMVPGVAAAQTAPGAPATPVAAGAGGGDPTQALTAMAGGGAPTPAPGAGPGDPNAQPRQPLTVKDLAIERIEMAREQAKAAETRIDDWMRETGYRAELRKVIADAARIGVGILKAPTPKAKRVMALTGDDQDGGLKLEIKDKIVPSAVWVDPWNIFPDPACGENIHEGDYCFERDFMSAKQVRGLKKLPGYIASALDRVLDEGPNKINHTDAAPGLKNQVKNRFEVWYFYGQLSRDEVEALELASGRDSTTLGDDVEEAHVIATLINDTVVRVAINPLDSGSFPYHSMPWQRRSQHWAGVGVSEQMKAPQNIVNAAVRALLNNAGKSAGSQFIMNQAAIRPADGSWVITPDKIWFTTAEGPPDVRQAFMAIQIPNVTEQLMTILQMGERIAEETTSIPLIAQGQSGATTPDTFGAAQLQNNNANQLLRSIGYAFDDHVTEPVVRQYYEWLLLDPDVPDYEKAEFQIDAHGSVALVERAIQDQSIAQMGSMAANPAFGIDPKKWSKMFIKSKRLSPGDLMYTDEEIAKMEAAPPPEAPPVTVAKIAADTQLKLGVMKQQAAERTEQNESQIAAAAHALEVGKVQNMQQATHLDATIQSNKLDMEHQRAMLQYANEQKVTLDQVKAQLAQTSMKLQVERELNAQNAAMELHKHHNPVTPPARPEVQAPGRAAPGHAADQSTGGTTP